MIIANITQIMNLNSGIRASIPRVANVVAIRQKTPIGASFMTINVIFIITLLNCVKKFRTALVSSLSIDSILPTINEKIIVGIISPLASELIGLEGIMFKRLSVKVTLAVMFDVYTDPAMFNPFPGCNTVLINTPRHTAINVVAR